MTQGIYSNRCWIDNQLQEATIFFNDGVITQLKMGKPNEQDIEDFSDKIIMPGVIDVHVHVNEPGRTEWEGFDTATKAAAAGGITTIVDMPLNASPVTTTVDALKQKLAVAEGKLSVNCAYYGGLIPGNENDIEALCRSGIHGIKAFLTHSGIDEFPNATEKELRASMPVLAKFDLPLLVHCELTDEMQHAALDKNPTSYKAYLKSRPKEWENKAIALMINLCREYNCRTHIVHVSSAESLALIEKAKEEGLPLTAETCPQYIYFNAEEIPDGNTLYKCAPPIREKENNELLKQAFQTGMLDFITSDHSPAPPSIKEIESGNLQKAWGGIAGLQFLLSSSWSALKNNMSLNEFIPLLTEHPAKFLKEEHHKGFLKEGYDADIAIWSPEESFIVKEEDIFHRHKASPYVGKTLFGKVHHTYVNGHLVFKEGQIFQYNKGISILRN